MSLRYSNKNLAEETKHIHHQLVAKAQDFDQHAQSKLYKLYNKAMFNTSNRIVADSFIAEDIMQDAFIDGFRKIKSLELASRFGPWLKRIVINKSLNAVNRTGMISNSLRNEEDSPILEESKEDDYEVQVGEVKIAMKSLAKQYQIIFSLYLIEGYDHEEIAEILGISSSTSRSQLSRAKQKVKEFIMLKRNDEVSRR